MTGSAVKCPCGMNVVERCNCMAEPGFSLRGVVRGEWGDIGRERSLAEFLGGSKSMCFTMFFCIFFENKDFDFKMLLSWPT